MKTYSLFSILAIFLVSNSVFARSDGIMRDQENECAIYLCAPAGFAYSECSSARSAFIARLTNVDKWGVPYYTPLPNFYAYCNDTSDQSSNNAVVGYIEREDAHIPEHKECLSMATEKKCIKSQGSQCLQYQTIKYCNAWKTVPEHYVENTRCDATGRNTSTYGYSYEHYKYDGKGQAIGSYHEPEWCDKTVTTIGVTINGVIQGEQVRY